MAVLLPLSAGKRCRDMDVGSLTPVTSPSHSSEITLPNGAEVSGVVLAQMMGKG